MNSKNKQLYIYSNAESEDRSDAISMLSTYTKEAPNIKFKVHTDGPMYFIDFIGTEEDIKNYLKKLGWYTDEEIKKYDLIKPYKLNEAVEVPEEQPLDEKQRQEALERMEILNLSRQCINAFKRGDIWESEGYGALYECNDEEKQIIKEFEAKTGGKVYHMIHNRTEFGELYSILYVSKDTDEWEEDKADLKDGYVFVYVKNLDDEFGSEFGSIGVRPSFGGLVRTS